MNLRKNFEFKAAEKQLLSSLEYKLFSPVDPWPETSTISASKLRHGVHFSCLDITGREKEKVEEFCASFKSLLPGLREYSVQKEVTRVLADLALSASSLLSPNNMKESEAKYSVIDPFIKALHSLTDVKVKLEESVKQSEGSNSMSEEVSDNSVPDYSVYCLYYEHQPVKIFFIEAKTSKSFNYHSICQGIGYYMASQTVHTTGDKYYPPLGLIMTEKKGHLVFFPYITSSGACCIDAAVSSSIELFSEQESKGFIALLTFISSYILLLSKQEGQNPIKDSEYSLHPKDNYRTFVLPEETYLLSQLEQKEQEMQEMQQKMQQKEQEMQQKEQEMQQEMQQKMQQKEQKMQQEMLQKEQEMLQKEQEMQQEMLQKEQEMQQKEQEMLQKEQKMQQKEQKMQQEMQQKEQEMQEHAINALTKMGISRSEAFQRLGLGLPPPVKMRKTKQ